MSDLPSSTLRRKVHQVLDPIWMESLENGGYREKKKSFLRTKGVWQVRKVARDRVYCWLAEKMWLTRDECHVSKFTTDQCHEAIGHLSEVTYIEIRAWARRQRRREQKATVEARAC